MAEASDFRFGTQLGYHKITPKEKVGVPWLGELPKISQYPFDILQLLKLATSNLVCSLGFPRPIIKLHPEEKWAWPCARGAP